MSTSQPKKYAFFIGRWQPFHNGHDAIIRKALDRGEPVLIGVRDTPVSEENPYSTLHRVGMIKEHFADEDVMVIPLPDIASVNIGRKVGYEVLRHDVPPDVEGISATEIRRLMAEGDESWRERVPHAIADYIVRHDKRGRVIWLTGLSGAGKTTIALALQDVLVKKGKTVKVLDGDVIRSVLARGLGYSKEDRDENVSRISYVAKCIADCGATAIVACISPYAEARDEARELIGPSRFVEVYVCCAMEELKKRDTKGLYAKAMLGQIEHFTGISDPYEAPSHSSCRVDTDGLTVEGCVRVIMNHVLMGKCDGARTRKSGS